MQEPGSKEEYEIMKLIREIS